MCDNISKRYNYLDLMKFIGITFVLIYHLRTVPIDFIDEPNWYVYVNYIISSIMSTCVPIFFFVNGFLLINKQFDLKKHLNKTLKLILITIIWSIITLISFILITGEGLSIYEFLKAIWNREQGLSHLWFMGALISIYLVFPLIKITYNNNRKVFNYFVVLCLILTFGNSILCMITTITDQILLNTQEYVNRNFFNIFNPLRGLDINTFAYFMLGCFISANIEKIDRAIESKKYINNITVALTIFFSTIFLSAWGILSSSIISYKWDSIWYGYDNIFTLVNVISIFYICRNYKYHSKNILCRFILTVSKNTFGIYFIHVIINCAFRELGLDALTFTHNYISTFFIVMIIMLICLAIIKVMSKIPFIRNLVRI